MPAIVAEESLREARRLMVGTGALSQEDAQAVIDEWRDALDLNDATAPPASSSPERVLGDLGIQFVRQPPTGEPVGHG